MDKLATKKTTKRTYYKKPSIRQRRAAKLIIEAAQGNPLLNTDAKIVVAAGYANSCKDSPYKVLDTSGVKEALSDYGFNSETAKKVVSYILENGEAENRDRLKAADMVFKVGGDYASDKNNAVLNASPIIFAKIEHHVFNFEAELKKVLGYETARIVKE